MREKEEIEYLKRMVHAIEHGIVSENVAENLCEKLNHAERMGADEGLSYK